MGFDTIINDASIKMNILIADAGSTKVEWALISESGEVLHRYHSDGLNALLAEEDYVISYLKDVGDNLSSYGDINQIFYYGAGCATATVCQRMEALLVKQWDGATVTVATDLLGAARSLFGDSCGIACILGTGSNSCLYDGKDIVKNTPSLGYILGDEGSGAALGKRLVADLFKGQLPETLKNDFLNHFDLTLPIILEKVYRSPAPNKFLASLMPFIAERIWNPYIYGMVFTEFSKFVKRNITGYKRSPGMKIGVIGSLAYHFEQPFREAMEKHGLKVDLIAKNPMEGLIGYHTNHFS